MENPGQFWVEINSVRLFTEFVSRRLAAYAPLLAGLISHD